LRSNRASRQELAPGGDQLLVAAGRAKPVDQLQHCLLVTRVGGVQPDERLPSADQPERPPALVVQVDQLELEFRPFLARSGHLGELRLECRGLFAHGVDFALGDGRLVCGLGRLVRGGTHSEECEEKAGERERARVHIVRQ
jgi:hypothetical protein